MQAAFTAAEDGVLLITKPTTSYRVGPITVPSNIKIIVHPGTTIQANAGLGATDCLMVLDDVSNVEIYGYDTLFSISGTYTGETRHAFRIRGSSNIFLYGMQANSTGGDGFYIGVTATTKYCENVRLVDVTSDGSWRNGLSIISGKHIHVINPQFKNTDGISPEAGIDIEPNYDTEFLEDIRIINPYTESNTGVGINVTGKNLGASGSIDVIVENHRDVGSETAFFCNDGISGQDGRIKNVNAVYIDSVKMGIIVRDWPNDAAEVIIDTPYIENPNTAGSASVHLGNGINIYNMADDSAGTLGNVKILNPIIKDTGGSPKMTCGIYVKDFENGDANTSKIQIINPIELAGHTTVPIFFCGAGTVLDNDRLASLDHTANDTIEMSECYSVHTNSGAGGAITLTLDDDIVAGHPDITFVVKAAQNLIIDPEANSSIRPLNTSNGQYIVSNEIGARITLRRISSTIWYVLNSVGTWTNE
jgi:hypothetical protein